MTQGDPPLAARRTSDRDQARFAEVDERRATASPPQAARDSIEGDALAEGAEIERHAPRAQRHARCVDLDGAPTHEPAGSRELPRRRRPTAAGGAPPERHEWRDRRVEGPLGSRGQIAAEADRRRERPRYDAGGITGATIQPRQWRRRLVSAHYALPG